ncbi:unnamed protein product [Trichobilharzia regenti]|nr:unnamed protein product [Trichobilharzia regenti]
MDAFMCYGAVVPNGYGAAYNPHPDNIVVILSNPTLSKEPSNEPVEWSIAKSLGAEVGLNVTG